MDTSYFSHINWLAVLVAAIAYFALGAIWFSRPVFGARWIALHEININDDNAKKAKVIVKQLQGAKIFRLPIAVDIYIGANKTRTY